MLKLWLVLIILFASYMFSVFLINKRKFSILECSTIIKSLVELKRQISLYMTESDRAIQKSFNIKNKSFFLNGLSKGYIFNSLNIEDKSVLYEFIEQIGYSNFESEINKCEYVINHFKDLQNKQKQEIINKSKLYKTLSISISLIVCVLIL